MAKVALIHENSEKNSERITKIKPLINKYNLKEIGYY